MALVVALGVTWGGMAGGGCACRRSSTGASGPAGSSPAPAPRAEATDEARCRACKGQFGPHGIDPTPRCICGTSDAGRRCRAKEDCEGDCVADAGEREVVDPGPPPRGHFLGRCSPLRTTFGCHHFLGPRAGPVRLDVAPEQLCVD